MKLFSFVIALGFAFSTFSQSADKGTWEIQADAGLGIYYQVSSINSNEGIGAVPGFIDINGSYFIEDKLSIGITARGNSYILDESDTSNRVNAASGGTLHFTTKYAWINNEKFNLYNEVGFGGSFINVNGISIDGDEGYAELRGNSYQISFGFNKYFSQLIGVNMALGYISQNYNYNYLELNGDEITSINSAWSEDNRASHRGIFMKIGLSFKF